ncbi:MAG TPA: glycosyltransferase family 1 protein [Acidimicrobiales bacterium]|nr:glycosyltransferase family 1 protein [Acidimicrobiales bacterium]
MSEASPPGEVRLRVAFDATPLLGPRTGVGEFCSGALQALAERADLAMGAYSMSGRRRHAIAAEVPAGVAVHDRPMAAGPLSKAWAHWSFPPAELFVGRTDVVHGTNFVVPPAWWAATVVTVHDLTPLRFPEMCLPPARAYPELVRKALGRGAWVHTHTSSVAQEVVASLGASPDRVRVVHPGVWPPSDADGSRDGPGDAVARSALLPDWVSQYVLAVGTVEPRKDLPSLVRAFGSFAKGYPGLALVHAGPDGWGSAQLEEAIAACPAGKQVVRLGWVDDGARDALMAGATVFAFPSLYEGFGLPPLQAMAAGVPVVATRCGALEEVLGDAARLVDVGDVDALADALEELLGDEPARLELSRRGRERAALYTWEACASGLAALYHDAKRAR